MPSSAHNVRPPADILGPPCKKMRLETPLCTESKEELPIDMAPFALDLGLSELQYDLIHTPVTCADLRPPVLDNWLEEPPLDCPPVTDAFSDISSEESKHPTLVPRIPLQAPLLSICQQDLPMPFTSTSSSSTSLPSIGKLPSSPANSECAIKPEDVHRKSKNTTASSTRASTANSHPSQSEIDSHKKRQADRAARNRESSRRAREKQKNRFIQLQTGNLMLQQTIQRYKLQVEHLQSSLERMHSILNSCSMCSYNATIAQQQQPQPQPQPSQPSQQSSQQPTQSHPQPHGSAQTHLVPNNTLLRQ
ncbi:unnamed protein product [Agarophyton chilense]|eukprot:gb/GEZJ01006037.1/.p1 GENE.gb/GEZJ01006037.1/~~gb/GEZJ01006037.1/.p1  ORF type:complete len:328 (-),score=38.87 gb/GEZJ01006037.1/:104-1021(-)